MNIVQDRKSLENGEKKILENTNTPNNYIRLSYEIDKWYKELNLLDKIDCYLTFRYLKDNQSAYIENILCNRKEEIK